MEVEYVTSELYPGSRLFPAHGVKMPQLFGCHRTR
jgi:hypothetical protein